MEDQTPANDNSTKQKNKTFLVIVGYLFILLGGLIAVIIGSTLRYKQVEMPNGQSAYKYSESDRKQGQVIANIAAVLFYIGLFLQIFV